MPTSIPDRLALIGDAEAAGAAITSTARRRISPRDNALGDEVEALVQRVFSLLPHLSISELLEVDGWTAFPRHFKRCASAKGVAGPRPDCRGQGALAPGTRRLAPPRRPV